MKKLFKALSSFGWGVLLYALLFIVAGVLLLAFPEDGLPTAIIVISVITMLYAVITAVIALTGKKRGFKFFIDLIGAIAALFCGIFLIIKRNDDAVTLLAFFIGALIVIDGSFKLHTATAAKEYKNAAWWILLVLSLITIVGGFFLVKRPPEAVKTCSVVLGLLMIIDGIQNGFITFYAPALENRLKRENSDKNAETDASSETAEPKKSDRKAEKAARKAEKKAAKKNKADHDDEVSVLPLDNDEYPVPDLSFSFPSEEKTDHDKKPTENVKTVDAEETDLADHDNADIDAAPDVSDSEPVDSVEIVVDPNEK